MLRVKRANFNDSYELVCGAFACFENVFDKYSWVCACMVGVCVVCMEINES